MEEKKGKALIVDAGKRLVETGLIARTWGNVSCRLNDRFFLVTPSGKAYEGLTPDDIVKVSLQDLSHEGNVRPSGERGAHRVIYAEDAEVNFIIHTHQYWASIVGALGVAGFSPGGAYSLLGGKVVCAEYGLPGTGKLTKGIRKAFRESEGKALIMSRHGAICYGKDENEAFQAANQLEEACRAFLMERLSQTMGRTLSDVEAPWVLFSLLDGKKELPPKQNKEGAFLLPKRKAGLIWKESTLPYTFCTALIGKEIRPMLDDFAQIVGYNMPVQNKEKAISVKKRNAVLMQNEGAVLWGKDESDAEAIRFIVEKNAAAWLWNSWMGGMGKPICHAESWLMRQVYLHQYARQK